MLLIADWNNPYACDDIEEDITWEQEQEEEEERLCKKHKQSDTLHVSIKKEKICYATRKNS